MVFLTSGDAGRTAVVTGGASGIGLACAERMAARGMNVVIADRADQATLDTALARVSASATSGNRVLTLRTDVTVPAEYEALCNAVYKEFNDCGLLFLNAGLSSHSRGFENETSAMKIPIQDWEKTFNVNIYGVLHGLQAFVPKMIAENRECVVAATSSYAGLVNASQLGFGSALPYTSSKHVVTLAMEALQHELRSTPNCQVRCTVLHPAGTATNFGKNNIQATLDDIMNEAEKESAREKLGRGVAGNMEKLAEMGIMMKTEDIATLFENDVGAGRFYCLAHDVNPKEYYKELIRTRFEDIIEERQPMSHLVKGDYGKPMRDRIKAHAKGVDITKAAGGRRAKL